MDINIIVKAALPIIFANEGSYSSVNADDNGAVSIGKVQWHATRALRLLKKIVSADRSEARQLLGEKLYQEIITVNGWADRILNPEETDRISKLLSTDQGIAAQDDQSLHDVTLYVSHGMKLGISDGRTLVYYADVENQGGAGTSRRIGYAAIKEVEVPDQVNLDIYHACALSDRVMKKYSARRVRVYNKCKTLEFAPPKNPYPVPKGYVRNGDHGPYVSWVQWELNQAGIDRIKFDGVMKRLKVDGVFGSITEAGVRQFQRKHRLKVDGIIGLNTLRALINDKQ